MSMPIDAGGADVLCVYRLGRLALRFGRVARATRHEDGHRLETDSDHTVMLGLVAVEVAAAHGVDVGRVAALALVHDLAEAYCGDTNSWGISEAAARAKACREADARRRLGVDFPDTAFLCLLDEYEAQASQASRLVRYLDKCLPKITHAANGCAALKAMGKTRDELVRVHREQGAALRTQYPELVSVVGPLFDALCTLAEEAW